jgi:hypothetical protein
MADVLSLSTPGQFPPRDFPSPFLLALTRFLLVQFLAEHRTPRLSTPLIRLPSLCPIRDRPTPHSPTPVTLPSSTLSRLFLPPPLRPLTGSQLYPRRSRRALSFPPTSVSRKIPSRGFPLNPPLLLLQAPQTPRLGLPSCLGSHIQCVPALVLSPLPRSFPRLRRLSSRLHPTRKRSSARSFYARSIANTVVAVESEVLALTPGCAHPKTSSQERRFLTATTSVRTTPSILLEEFLLRTAHHHHLLATNFPCIHNQRPLCLLHVLLLARPRRTCLILRRTRLPQHGSRCQPLVVVPLSLRRRRPSLLHLPKLMNLQRPCRPILPPRRLHFLGAVPTLIGNPCCENR